MEMDELISCIDIVEYISQFVDLTEKNGEYWGLSCFKDEKTPSFSVRRNPPVFYDYSSGIGGNVYTFVKRYNNCSPRQTVEILKKYAGVDGEVVIPHERLEATKVAKRFSVTSGTVKESKASKLPDDYMERYERRRDKIRIWIDEGISEEAIEKYQVRYDGFSNSLVYPIRDINGNIVNIGARTLDPKWKEKGLRKYTYFKSWGVMDVIFGISENMDDILKKKEIILFEGAKSVMKAYSWGIRNTGAILTSHLNPSQLKLLAKLGVKIVFALDKDVRVREDHNISKLKYYCHVDYLWDREDLLDDKDSPVDKGKETFLKLYNERLHYK